MYRITGDQYWRDRGWEMFTAVQDHTRTVFGNSAIDDVTREAPELEVCDLLFLLFDRSIH
jgi:mannosyl-oligosaccharide alpha-1,2-mannosidase